MRTHTTKHNKTHGFSLIEIMVSLSVFAMVMVASVGALLTIVDANAKAQALYSAMTNLSFAVDSIGRNIRTGYNYLCLSSGDNRLNLSSLPSGSDDCTNGNDAIVFTREKDGYRVGYRLNGSMLEQREVGGGNDTDWLPITAEATIISNFDVVVEGSTAGDEEQPVASILIEGAVNNGLDIDTKFTLQTKVTQRILNY